MQLVQHLQRAQSPAMSVRVMSAQEMLGASLRTWRALSKSRTWNSARMYASRLSCVGTMPTFTMTLNTSCTSSALRVDLTAFMSATNVCSVASALTLANSSMLCHGTPAPPAPTQR